MVRIRLARAGARKKPFYYIHVADKRAPRDGRFIERLGFFDPFAQREGERLRVRKERLEHWLGQGARMSERVSHLIRSLDRAGKTPAAKAPQKAEKGADAAPAAKQERKGATAKKEAKSSVAAKQEMKSADAAPTAKKEASKKETGKQEVKSAAAEAKPAGDAAAK